MTAFAAARTVADAVALLAALPGAVPVAGGTDLVVGARAGKRGWPEALVAIHGIEELRRIEELPGGGLRVGALVTHAGLAGHPAVRRHFAALADASAIVGSPATRATGTVGGNLANASPAMELGSPLLVHGAEVELAGPGGARRVALSTFLAGPGRTTARPGELVVAVHLPAPGAAATEAAAHAAPGAHAAPSATAHAAPGASGSAYVRLQYRRAMEIAVVGAAALVTLAADGTVADARVALTAVAPTCIEVPGIAAVLAGRAPTDEALAAAAAIATAAAAPIADVRASDAYRRAQVPVAVRRALAAAAARASGDHAAAPIPSSNCWSP